MATISAADVNKLRQQTGAGMMDCKKALTETDGDFEAAIDLLRKKGQKVAANRGDRDAKEGCVIALTSADQKAGVVIALNCETDFVAKNQEFIDFTTKITEIAVNNKPASADALKALPYEGDFTIDQKITEMVGKIGEKIEISSYEIIEGEQVAAYIHLGNKLATIVSFNQNAGTDLPREIAMQVAAMAPVAVSQDGVDQSIIDRELDIARELARQEGKPEDMLDKIAQGRLNKFFKESTLLNQQFIRDNKKTIAQYLSETNKDLTVTDFKRIALG